MIDLTWANTFTYYVLGAKTLMALVVIAYIAMVLFVLYSNAKHFALYEEYIPKNKDYAFGDIGAVTLVAIFGGGLFIAVWPLSIVVFGCTGLFKLFVTFMHWKYGKERVMLKLKHGNQEKSDA